MQSRCRPKGFTLLELAITMLVIALLAVIAYPSYQDNLRKGRRVAAQSFMLDAANREQQYLLDARGYAVGADAFAALNLTLPSDVAPFYTLMIQPLAPTVPPSYTIVATPVADSAQASDEVLTLDHQGNRTRGGNAGW